MPIGKDLQEAIEPYESMIQSALADYHQAWKALEPTTETVMASARVEIPDMETLKNTLSIDMPPAVTAISYSNKIKTEAVPPVLCSKSCSLFTSKRVNQLISGREGASGSMMR